MLCLYFFPSFIAWSKSCSLSSCNFKRRWEEGMVDLGLGEHHSRKLVTIRISCQFDSVWTSSSSSKPFIHINFLEPFEIWSPFHSYSYCYWSDTHKMIRLSWSPKGSSCSNIHTRKISLLQCILRAWENICKWRVNYVFWAFISSKVLYVDSEGWPECFQVSTLREKRSRHVFFWL